MIERIFKAYDIRGTYPDMLNEDAAWKIGYATALFFQRSRNNSFGPKVRSPDTLLVGRDMRPHSPQLAAALIEGVRASRMNVIDTGMVDTPFLHFAINHLDCAGGIQVTASHNPLPYNGFNVAGARAQVIGGATGLEDIKRIASTLRVGKTGYQGTLQQQDLWSAYRRHVLQFLDLKRKMRVVVDASNGMAGGMVPAIFDNLPQLQVIPLLFETDGSFVHEPNPLVSANLAALRERVGRETPDLGVCFDGDADRCAFVDERGQPVRADLVAVLVARDLIARPGNTGRTVVFDVRATRALPEEIAEAAGIPRRARVGPLSMRRAMADTRAIFGAELSGHFYFGDNYTADSGAIAFARILSVLSAQTMPFSSLVRPLARYAQSGELSFVAEDRDARIRELADRYRKAHIDYLDGMSVDCTDFWFNVRKSNTEPLLRLNLECHEEAMLQAKLQELRAILGDPV
jgi:phosphomannomutase